jgi:hypothetical protein
VNIYMLIYHWILLFDTKNCCNRYKFPSPNEKLVSLSLKTVVKG